MDHETAAVRCAEILDAVGSAVIADDAFLEAVLTGVLARGHVLLEDVPGTGKTLTARSFANALDLSFRRIQFTLTSCRRTSPARTCTTRARVPSNSARPHLLPRRPGRRNQPAPPKTQAALLEAMGEGQVTVDGETHELPDPFFVIATQNPVEQEGTFGLPEAPARPLRRQDRDGLPGVRGRAGTHRPTRRPHRPGAQRHRHRRRRADSRPPARRRVRDRRRQTSGLRRRAGRATREDDRVASASRRAGSSASSRPPAPAPSSRAATTSFPTT